MSLVFKSEDAVSMLRWALPDKVSNMQLGAAWRTRVARNTLRNRKEMQETLSRVEAG